MEDTLYKYKAKVRSIYDGDSMRLDIDLGFKVWMTNQRVRLAGLNAPEIRGEEREKGLKTLEVVKDTLKDHDEILIETQKDKYGKYGRWLVTVWLYEKYTDEWFSLNDLLIAEGYAEKYTK